MIEEIEEGNTINGDIFLSEMFVLTNMKNMLKIIDSLSKK